MNFANKKHISSHITQQNHNNAPELHILRRDKVCGVLLNDFFNGKVITQNIAHASVLHIPFHLNICLSPSKLYGQSKQCLLRRFYLA